MELCDDVKVIWRAKVGPIGTSKVDLIKQKCHHKNRTLYTKTVIIKKILLSIQIRLNTHIS